MRCSIIRDLLPLYEEQLCSKETTEIVEDHLKECDECKKLYDEMNEGVGLKEAINSTDLLNVELEEGIHDKSSQEFWRKYYGSLLLKGVGIFLIIYIIVVTSWVIFGGVK